MTRITQLEQIPEIGDFLNGTVEEVIMTSEPTVAVTWLHTNEPHAPRVAHRLYTERPDLAPYVNYICGDPITAQNDPARGFNNNDLNRSFDTQKVGATPTYEQTRAAHILRAIERARYVVDPHNTVSPNFGKIAIADQRFAHTGAVRDILAASVLDRILLMTPEVSQDCLIGEPLGRAVTLEYQMELTDEGVDETIRTIEALITGKPPHEPFVREVFTVGRPIPKSEDPGLDVKNFELYSPRNGDAYYPLFLGTGPRSYREDRTKTYCGFAATREFITL